MACKGCRVVRPHAAGFGPQHWWARVQLVLAGDGSLVRVLLIGRPGKVEPEALRGKDLCERLQRMSQLGETQQGSGRGGHGDRQRGGGPRKPAFRDPAEVGKLFDRLPPHSLEAEMALLGSMMIGPEVIADVLGLVAGAQDFYSAPHGQLFTTICELYDTTRTVDLVQLVDAVRDMDVLKSVGGDEYLVQLAEQVPSAVNAPHYARIVADKARLRRLIETCTGIIFDAYTGPSTGPEQVRELLDRAEANVFEIAQEPSSSDPQMLKQLLENELERIEATEGKGISGLPTGYVDLDEKLRGMQQGEMIIIAARPSMGKTALALNLAEQLALGGRTPWDSGRGTEPVPIAFFSLEMSKSAVTQRLLSSFSGVEGSKLRDGSRLGDDWDRLIAACNQLSELPIVVDDTPGLTVMQLRARARRLASQQDIKCIVVDYLQLLSAPAHARESRQVEVSTISRNLKALARELSVPIVCLSQLNRATEQREGNRPRMSDLRESGSIEQDADVVMLLHREAYYHRGDPKWDPHNPAFDEENRDKLNLSELIVAKQRNGPTGTVKLVWDSPTTRFKNYTGNDYDDPPSGNTGGYEMPVEPKPSPYSNPPKPRSGAFAPGRFTGPVDGHRDGGGPDGSHGGGGGGAGGGDEIAPF